MSDTQSAVADFLAARARQAPADPPATAGQAWDAEWAAAGLSTVTGQARLFEDAREQLSSAIAAEAGRPIEDYARDHDIRLGEAGGLDHGVRLLGNLAATLPEDAQKRIAPLLDVRANAQQKAAEIAATAGDAAARSQGLSGGAIRFAAGAARQALDPVNVGAMVLTAPLAAGEVATAPLWMTMARQAMVAGAAQALQEPLVQAGNVDLGLDHGFGEATGDVLNAAVGGGILSGGLSLLFRGGAAALRRVRNAERGASAAAPEVTGTPERPGTATALDESPRPGVGHADIPLAPADLDAVGRLAERDQVLDAVAPERTAAGAAVHGAAIENAAGALEEGRPIAEPVRAVPEGEPTAREPMSEPAAEPEPAVSDLPLPEETRVKVAEPEKPAAPPAPAKAGEVAGAPAPGAGAKLGDTSLAADAERVLAENGGDIKVRLDHQAEGPQVSARDALGQADEDAAAARELADCAAMEAT